MKKNILSILLATLWISASEFLRNQFLLHSAWIKHYQNLGLVFPEKMINGTIWGIWSLLLAINICILAKKFNLWKTTILAWLMGFVLMWLTIGNLSVLPYSILYIAVPWSFLETLIATFIIKKLK